MSNIKYSDKKIVWFQNKLNSLKDGNVTDPIYVRIKPINRCCHKCYFCVYNAEYSNMHHNMDKSDMLSKEKLFEILDDFKEMGVKSVTYSGGGEPLIHPDIVDVLKKTKDNGIDLSMLTNGQLLHGDRAKEMYDASWIRLSIDYHNPKLFHESRGLGENHFHQIIENIQNFKENKKPECDLTLNYIITKSNYQEIWLAAEFFKKLKFDNIRFSPVWTKDFLDYHQEIQGIVLKELEIARKDLEDENYKIFDSYKISVDVSNRKYNRCYIMQASSVIGADGKIYTCHNKAYDSDGIIGDINEKSFKDVWYSNETKEFFNKFNPIEKCNHQCANDGKNIFIEEILNCYGDNFI